MILTLPAVELARVADAPSTVLIIGGVRFAAHAVSEAVHHEAPVIDVSWCTSCGCKAAADIRTCAEPVCPSRDRRAA